jgi:hypothetical protein
MGNHWEDRALGWGLSLLLHAAVLVGATTIAFYPCPWGIPPGLIAFQDRPPDPVFLFNLVERPRDLFDRTGGRPEAPALRSDADSGREDDLGPGPGFTHRGIGETGRVPFYSPAEGGVIAALRWLGRHQNADGSWSAGGFDGGYGGTGCSGLGHRPGDGKSTVLALRAFVASGYAEKSSLAYVDPAAPNREICFGDIVSRAIRWLEERGFQEAWLDDFRPSEGSAPALLSSQKTRADGCKNGAWDSEEEGCGSAGARVRATALSTLSLIAARKVLRIHASR